MSDKKFFPQCVAQINMRAVNRSDEVWKEHRPFFDTWEAAHDFMLSRAYKQLERARRELAFAQRHAEKVQAMTPKAIAP